MASTPPGQRHRRRAALILVCCVVVAAVLPVVGCASARSTTTAAPATSADPTASMAPDEAMAPGEDELPDRDVAASGRLTVPSAPTVTVTSIDTVSWAYLDRASGARFQSDNADQTSFTESMVKAWLAADDLNRSAAAGIPADDDLLVPMIVDSDDNAAETVWLDNGADESIARMIEVCQLVDTEIFSGWWSKTLMSARDAVSLGQCIVDGTAAGPGTDWLLSQMRQVRGEGRFGILDALTSAEASSVAIKNGWTLHYDDGLWRVNCLAIHPDWIIAVMSTYPGTDSDLAYGATLCAQITTQLLDQTSSQ
jgi:hypothetical protein